MEKSQLSEKQVREMVEAARQARANAYAPYSRFPVGAALLASDGRIFGGCNVENGSFGLTLCAERVALGNAISHGCRDFQALAIVAEGDQAPVTPCGACRQSLAEFNPFLTIICANEEGRMRVVRLDELLPYHFEFGLH